MRTTGFICDYCKRDIDPPEAIYSVRTEGLTGECHQTELNIDLCGMCHGGLIKWLQDGRLLHTRVIPGENDPTCYPHVTSPGGRHCIRCGTSLPVF